MGLFGLSFGKKRRSTKRHMTKKHSKKVAKPPAKLLRLCKKYRVKATKKVGSKRVYKKVAVLKKLCLRKARALRKKLMKMMAKKAKKHSKKTKSSKKKVTRRRKVHHPRKDAFGEEEGMSFGKRRSSRKVSKVAAMKAFRSFYKRHCAGARGSRFGNGGNPPLHESMGYEFCPNGMGGVLGFNSTGLFPSPCTSYSSSAPTMMALPPPTKVSMGGFGVKRRSAAGGVKRRSAAGGGFGAVHRRRSVKRRSVDAGGFGAVHRRRYVKRRSAAGCANDKQIYDERR